MDQASVDRYAKAMDAYKYVDEITPLWSMVEQRARIVVRKGLGQDEVGPAEVAVKKAYISALGEVVDTISLDVTETCYNHLRANINTVKEKIK